MKIFWSWQSDIPGKIGRHFVRDALKSAVETLKLPPDVEEPTAAETREAIHLDQDRQGVTGSPDLAATIFAKIELAAVFVADMTLVGTSDNGSKRLVNPNVAIEYGHAHHALGSEAILMVQNIHYGDRDALPFDLKHKAGPLQFRLAPDATKSDIETEHKKLVGQFVSALRPFVEKAVAQAGTPFEEVQSIGTPATFFGPDEVLGTSGIGTEDEIHYKFAENRAFYLRVMPSTAQPRLKNTRLMDIASSLVRPDLLSLDRFSGYLDRNRFGVIAIEYSGTSRSPRALSQLFATCEAWGISTYFFRPYNGLTLIPTLALGNIYRRVLSNFSEILNKGMSIAPPYTVVMGAVGLEGIYVGVGNNAVDGPIHETRLEMRLSLNDLSAEAQATAVGQFVEGVLDLAGVLPPTT